ncbi:MAG: alpha-mannosidase, partial [Shimia sp.]
MSHARRFTAQKIEKRIKLVDHMVFRNRLDFAPFRITRLPDAGTDPPLGADPTDWPEIPWSSYWGGQNINYMLSTTLTIPSGWGDGGPIALYLPMGAAGDIFTHPESLVYIDGEPFASADRYHHTIYLPDALADGLPHRIELHGWTGLTDWPPDPNDRTQLFMGHCQVVEIDVPTRDFLDRAEVAWGVARELSDQRPEKHRILTALDQAFLHLDTRDPLRGAFYRSVPGAREALEAGLKEAGEPIDVTLHGIGHAHMDIAYLWPISQIRRKNARTYSNVLRLMERFPDYTFSHSQPQLYDYTKRDYPEVFAQIKERVAEGRWEVMGGMWVEPDTNIPGGEALVRQLILGRRFFREHFGDVETPVLWLPDVFGLSWCLPQLIKQAGLKYLLSNKFSWNQYNQHPATTLFWEGIDGTRVLTHFLTTPRTVQHLPFPTNYKSDLSAAEVMGTWEKNTAKEHIRDLPICYGYGDGGGGPTGKLIRKAKAYQDMPGAPRVEYSTARAFFEAIEPKAPALHVWADELYLEGHRGVLTSQGWIKRANRRAEHLLHEVEYLAARAVMAGRAGLPQDKLTKAWELLCQAQFHDILPGTSVTEVFEDARLDFARIEQLAEEVRAWANADGPARSEPGAGPSSGTVLAEGDILANALPFTATRQKVVGHAPSGVSQPVDGGHLIQMNAVAPYASVALRADPPQGTLTVTEEDGAVTLANDLIEAHFNREGTLIRVYDRQARREVLKPGQNGNRLQVFEDRPLSWDAWDIDSYFEDRGEIITGLTRFEITERGPLRATVRIERSYRNSTVVQDVQLRADSKRLDFRTEVDWHETHLLLKVAFPVDIHAREATYEIQWGSIERPTHRNTLWDYAKFEVCAHKWADLSEADYGVALINDCK